MVLRAQGAAGGAAVSASTRSSSRPSRSGTISLAGCPQWTAGRHRRWAGHRRVARRLSRCRHPLAPDEEKAEQHQEDVAVAWSHDMDAATLAYILFQAPVLSRCTPARCSGGRHDRSAHGHRGAHRRAAVPAHAGAPGDPVQGERTLAADLPGRLLRGHLRPGAHRCRAVQRAHVLAGGVAGGRDRGAGARRLDRPGPGARRRPRGPHRRHLRAGQPGRPAGQGAPRDDVVLTIAVPAPPGGERDARRHILAGRPRRRPGGGAREALTAAVGADRAADLVTRTRPSNLGAASTPALE
jgi:hypothetical protein